MVKQATNLRRCVVCRCLVPRTQLLRVVRLAQSGTVQVANGVTDMGRSAYLCPQRACWQQAQRKNRFASALRSPVAATLYTTLEAALCD